MLINVHWRTLYCILWLIKLKKTQKTLYIGISNWKNPYQLTSNFKECCVLHTQYLLCDCTNAWSNRYICRGIYRHGDRTFLSADTKKPDKIFSRCRCREKALFCPPVALLLSDGQKDGTWHYWVKRGPAKSDITWIRPGSRLGYNGTEIVFCERDCSQDLFDRFVCYIWQYDSVMSDILQIYWLNKMVLIEILVRGKVLRADWTMFQPNFLSVLILPDDTPSTGITHLNYASLQIATIKRWGKYKQLRISSSRSRSHGRLRHARWAHAYRWIISKIILTMF